MGFHRRLSGESREVLRKKFVEQTIRLRRCKRNQENKKGKSEVGDSKM